MSLKARFSVCFCSAFRVYTFPLTGVPLMRCESQAALFPKYSSAMYFQGMKVCIFAP